VDGYAVTHADLAVQPLTVEGEIPAGGMDSAPIHKPNTAVRIFTGGFVPQGADTVIRQEYTALEGGKLSTTEEVAKGADFRQQGEEVQHGALLAKAGSKLTPGLIGSLSNSGIVELAVYQQPRVRVLITGNEVIPPGNDLKPGQVYDANGATCLNFFKAQGIKDLSVQWVKDDADTVKSAMQNALDECDLLITTGGVSVGDYDYIPSSCDALGAATIFHKVAQKPGMPLLFATLENKAILGLPGNPAAVAVNLNLYAKRILDLFGGCTMPGPIWHKALLLDDIRADGRRDRWVRMHQSVNENGQITLGRLRHQASHMLTNMNEANALIRVFTATDLAAGDVIDWCPAS
ncbi:MAG: molybdopterin molybdotransferase MoeA, partial [Gammaproteobacteria bacterium]|nr:molybdopterin molybdotransferase MoeA [Gammaproteobacteria bacterium]